ncbi:cysteine hydrolase family protein [Microbulbifer taiwanensis]|uniref:cysteine hydrolase family protein n=1 Tax=Microbulbifer taiwanensis TaxID=986746 RepID=UPI003616BD84
MKSALLCIDLQYLDAARGCGVFADSGYSAFGKEGQEYYFARLEKQVLPNVQKLQALFRDKGLEVIHIRVMSQTDDGRDRSYWHRKLDLHCPPGSRESEFIESVAPKSGDLVINKTASGPFGNSNIHSLLSRLGIAQLYCCGVFTDVAVESTIRAAADFGYCPMLIEDATASASDMVQAECVNRLGGVTVKWCARRNCWRIWSSIFAR